MGVFLCRWVWFQNLKVSKSTGKCKGRNKNISSKSIGFSLFFQRDQRRLNLTSFKRGTSSHSLKASLAQSLVWRQNPTLRRPSPSKWETDHNKPFGRYRMYAQLIYFRNPEQKEKLLSARSYREKKQNM